MTAARLPAFAGETNVMTNSRSNLLALVAAIAAAALPVRAQQNANQPGTTWSDE